MNKKAFSLIELIVSISIIVIFFALIAFSPRGFYVQSLADQDALIIKNDILKAYNNTISGFTYGGYGYDHGFGLYFNISTPKKYIYFIDKNDNFSYNTGELIEEVEIKNSTLYNLNGQNTLSIIFKEREAALYVNGATELPSDIIIDLMNNTVIKKVKINPKTYKINVE